MQLGSHTVATGSVLWLYPNAVHLDEGYFPEPKAFCPMRLLNGNLERMSADFELVTFGHGQKRCIGEKMARAMILSFLAEALPNIDAEAQEELPEDGFFDLIPASELRLKNVRDRGASKPLAAAGSGAMRGDAQRLPEPPSWIASFAADKAADTAADVARDVAKAGGHLGRVMLWEFWLALWRTWTASTEWRETVGAALWKDSIEAVSSVADRVSRVVQLERLLASDTAAETLEERPRRPEA